ncbi:SusD/RagB family nutrient-binding outer membrane lipoprotein [Bacteroides sp. UBA939]|uniref:SusD/RagB family nutrient-binding outer membrane lipoprotein n=1 Tax=Bacteroides sp. UBA939 TaxID=1946092 RepID=UPI0025C46207|nr:SusD/RagB family nutrient-binding outer membrane lipoprotein [Bacteroides sp. UBA939]
MKLYKKIILGVAACVSLSACSDWLDVNTNPNTPISTDAQFHQRVPWMQFYMSQIYHIVAANSTFYCGHLYRTDTRDGAAAKWQLNAGTRAANAQQWFYTQVGVNCNDLYNQAMEAGAYHYAGAAKFFRAYGFMMLTDLFGEVPYNDAFGANPSPAYDNGKTIFLGCVADIDEAIELFSKPQETVDGVVPIALVAGDSWNGGDASKWLKMCYLLKARWLNHLVKKEAGSYKDGKYDAQEILSCLAKAQQSNADNTIIRHPDINQASRDVLGWNEPVDYSAIYSVIGGNNGVYITKCYYDNLTNFDGKGIEDPRADKFIPWTRSVKGATTPADIKWSDDGMWRRSMGVDLQTDILSQSGPYAPSFNTETQSWYCNSSSRQGDTIYVYMKCGSTGYGGEPDLLRRFVVGNERSALSGVYSARATSPTYMASYAEVCFIKAEVLFRQGDKSGAFTAYRDGVKASIDAVNEQLDIWASGYPNLQSCPSFSHIEQADIDNFLNNSLGTSADLTMGKIMTQKLLSMPFSNENWNDMRRHDFSTDVFMNWDKPFYYRTTPAGFTYCPEGEYPRRWKQASYELQYNTKSLSAIGAEVPGAEGPAWYNSNTICTIPVWWDSNQP